MLGMRFWKIEYKGSKNVKISKDVENLKDAKEFEDEK